MRKPIIYQCEFHVSPQCKGKFESGKQRSWAKACGPCAGELRKRGEGPFQSQKKQGCGTQ